MWLYHSLFIHSSVVDGHLSGFCLLAVVNSAAVNIRLHHIRIWCVAYVFISRGRIPRSGIAGLYSVTL